jgi:acyl-CoA reductase-like NAD-dependent aldehyde dehydrogenase
MVVDYGMFINGEFVGSHTGATYDVVNPANGAVIARVPKGDAADVRAAADAAYDAKRKWAETHVSERSRILLRIADVLRANADRLAELETANHGSPIRKTRNFDVPLAADVFEYYAEVARAVLGEVNPAPVPALDFTLKEPVGVAGLIIPWNFPLLMASWKIAPALAAGNTVVAKPASVTPLSLLEFARLTRDLLPRGVFNVVTGPGSVVGDAMVLNEKIDLISLTGSTETGQKIMEKGARTLKRLALELGGKNPLIVLDDADVEAAVEGAVMASFFNSGQVCATSSRIYVHERVHDEFVRKFVEATKRLVVGDPMDPNTDMGPVAYFEHKRNIERYIEIGLKEGARMVLGGPPPEHLSGGAYVMPTIFDDGRQDMTIVQEEIFGPVDVILRFSSDEEAIEMANGTKYGLSASVWTRDIARAGKFIRGIDAGTVWVNEHIPVFPETPWGGFKMSGTGTKELSQHALDTYLRLKHVSIDLTGLRKKPWYSIVNPH